MKHQTLRSLILITCIVSLGYLEIHPDQRAILNCSTSKNTALYRPFSSYSLHDLLAENLQLITQHNKDDHELYFSVIPEYMQSANINPFQSCGFGALPFWSGSNTLTIGTNNGKAQLDAYQLGLGNVVLNSDGIAGKIQLCPQITHVGSDFILNYMHHAHQSGFFFKIHAPLVSMSVQSNLKELEIAHPDGLLKTTVTGGSYINANYSSPNRRYLSVSHAFFGGLTDTGNGNLIDGNISKPIRLRHGRIAATKITEIRLSDLSSTLGCRVVFNKDKNFSFGFKVACPTGNIASCEYMIEPIVGRGGAWALGADLSGVFQFVGQRKNATTTTISFQSELLHLIPGRRINLRTFDLKQNGPGSKYLLIQEYPSAYSVDSTSPGAPIYGEARLGQSIHPAANLTTLPVISNISCEGSFAILFDFLRGNWTSGFGGELWGRTREHLSMDIASIIALRMPKLNDYAVIGRQVGNYLIDGQSSYAAKLCEPLATIGKSKDPVNLTGASPNIIPATPLPDGIKDASIAGNRIPMNLNDALDICGAEAPKVVTVKAFGKIGYVWKEKIHTPSLQLFGGVELVTNNTTPQFWSIGCAGTVQF